MFSADPGNRLINAAAGIPRRPRDIRPIPAKIAQKLVRCGVSAIFCMNDMLAGGAIDFMHDHGISIPEKLSIVGFDNIAASSAYYPKLTTVALPLLQIGRESVACALRLLHRHTTTAKGQIISMPCHIIYRNSVREKANRTNSSQTETAP